MNREQILGLKINLGGSTAISLIGTSLLLIGIFLAVWSTTTLGMKAAARMSEIVYQKGILVTKGPYSIIRHPIYLGEFIIILGNISGVRINRYSNSACSQVTGSVSNNHFGGEGTY